MADNNITVPGVFDKILDTGANVPDLSTGIQGVPDYQYFGSNPVNLRMPSFGSSMPAISNNNPVADGIKNMFAQQPSFNTLGQSTEFNPEQVNINRYKASPDFFKLGVSLTDNNEEIYGQNQSWSEVLGNGITGMRNLAYNGFVDNVRGWGRLTDALISWDWSKLHGDAASMMELDNNMKKIMNDNPIYATEKGTETFWNRETFGNFLQQSGFTVGALAEIVAEQAITKAIEGGLAMSGIGAGAAATIEAAEDISTTTKVGRLASFFSKSKEFFDAAKNFKVLKAAGDIWKSESAVKAIMSGVGDVSMQIAKRLPVVDLGLEMYRAGKAGGTAMELTKIGVGGVKRLLSESNFAFTEARMEAAGTYTDLVNQMNADYYNRNGQYAQGSDLEAINQKAMKAADGNFNFNSAILFTSNRIMFNNLFKGSKATSKMLSAFGEQLEDGSIKVLGKINGRTTAQLYKSAIKDFGKISADFGRTKALTVAGKSIMASALNFEVIEGIQELLQEGSNEYFKDYYMDAYKATYNPLIQPDSEKSLDEAIESQKSMQGLKTFASGALTGMLIHGPTVLVTKSLQKASDKITTYNDTKNLTPEKKAEYLKNKAERESAGEEFRNNFNAIAKDPSKFFGEHVRNYNVQKEGAAALSLAAKLGDKFAYENVRTDMMHNILIQAVANNTHEALVDTMRSYGQNMTKEEFEQAFVGMDYTAANKKTAEDYVGRVADSIESYVNTRGKLVAKYGHIANPNKYKFGSKEWLDESIKFKTLNNYIDILAGNEFKATDALNRNIALFQKAAANKNLGSSLAAAFQILGSERNMQQEMAVLKAELANKKSQLDAATNADDKVSIQKEMDLKQEQLDALNSWNANKENVTDGNKQETFEAFKKYVEIKNREAGKDQTINIQDIEDHYLDFVDYIKLNTKAQEHTDALNFLSNPENFKNIHDRLQNGAKDAYFELLKDAGYEYVKKNSVDKNKHFIIQAHGYYAVYSPEGKLVGISDNQEDANKIKNDRDAALAENPDLNKNTVDITYTTASGETKTYQVNEGDVYVGNLYKSTKYSGVKPVTLFNNDRVKIVSISDDGKSVTIKVNQEEPKVIDANELAQIMFENKWRKYETLNADQKLYLTLRNSKIKYRVLKRDAKGKVIKNQKGGYETIEVTGRVTLDKKTKQNLMFTYIDPVSGKTIDVDYQQKYVVETAELKAILKDEEQVLKEQEQKVAEKFTKQQEYLSNLISQVEAELNTMQAQRDNNEKEFEALQQELEDLNNKVAEAAAYIQANPYVRGRKSNAYKQMEELAATLPATIEQKEKQLEMLAKERENLSNILEALNQASETYYSGLIELEETGTPFLADETGTLYGNEQEQLDNVEQTRITTRFTADQLTKMIGDTEAEIDAIDERVKYLTSHIDNIKSLLKTVLSYKDVVDALMDITDRDMLRNQLKLMESQSSDDPAKMQLIKAIRTGLAKGEKGIEAQYLLELMNRYKEFNNEFEDLIKERDVLAPKLFRLKQSLEQQNAADSLKERIDFLKFIQEGLMNEYKRGKTTVQPTTSSSDAEHNLLTNPSDQEISNEDGVFDYDVKKPLLAVNSLYVTTGKHFVDDADTQVNEESGNARFFKFSQSVDLANSNYFFLPITVANDTYGITRSDLYADDIKLVAVKLQDGVYKFVDENGEVLENPTKDNMIYTSMRGNDKMLGSDVAAAVDYVKSTFTTKGFTDAEIAQEIAKYKAFREAIKTAPADSPMYLPIKGKTKGIAVILPKDAATGLPQELSLEGRLIQPGTTDFMNMKHPDGQNIRMFVSTAKSVKVGVKPGRLVMMKADGTVFRVFNRQATEAEKDNFIELLKMLTGLYGRKADSLSRQEKQNLNDILSYLTGFTHWTTTDSESKSANRFYISSQDGMLYKGNKAIPFTVASIEENKADLVSGLYHQVNNKLLLNDKQFVQPIVKNGKLSVEEYKNYSEYVLSDKNANGNDRQLGPAVVYTNIPVYTTDTTTPQLKSVNLLYDNPNEPVLPKNIQVVQTQAGTPALTVSNTGFVDTSSTPIPSTPSAGNKWVISATPAPVNPEANTNNSQIQNPNQTVAQQNPVQQSTVNKWAILANPPASANTQATVDTTPAPAAPVNPVTVDPVATVTPAVADILGMTPSQKAMLLTSMDQNTTFDINDVDDINATGDIYYRLHIQGQVIRTEEFSALKEWFNKNLPNIPVNKVAELIDGKAWGAFKNGAVYIYENAEEGTGFHEAFEAVWNAYLLPSEQQDLAKAFQSRQGEFTNPFTNETKAYANASMYDVREMLAEEFRSYMLNEKTAAPKESAIVKFFKDLWNFIKSLVGMSKEEKQTSEDLINKLFTKINEGKFANAVQVRSSSEMGTYYRQVIPETTQEFTSLVTEGLTAFFFQNLFANNKNIDSLVDKNANTNELLKKIFMLSMRNLHNNLMGKNSIFYKEYVLPEQNKIGREFTHEEIASLFEFYFTPQNRFASMYSSIFLNPAAVFYNLKQSLSKFGIEFKEKISDEEEALVEDKENILTDRLGIKDSMTIDPKKLSSVSFRMLIGSLTNDEYNAKITAENPNPIISKNNTIGVPQLVNYEATMNMLLNELNSTVSRYKDGEFVDALSLMIEKLDNKYYNKTTGRYKDNYVWIERLKKRLKAGKYGENIELSNDDIRSMIAFEKSLSNKQNIPLKTIIDKDGVIYDSNPIQTGNGKRVLEVWENNVIKDVQPLATKGKNNLLGIDDKGMVVIDKNSYQYVGNPNDKTQAFILTSNPSFEQKLNILELLGIKFTAPAAELRPYANVINDSYIAIMEQLQSIANPIVSLDQVFKTDRVSSRINKLVEIEAAYTSEDNVLMHTNAKGESQYSITSPSAITYVLSSLNSAANLNDFIKSNPQFGRVNTDGTVELFPYQAGSEILKLGGLVFDAKGNKRSNIQYHLISGMAHAESDGKNTDVLEYPDRVAQEIHYLLKNVHYTVINSDKSNEFGLGYDKAFINSRMVSTLMDETTNVANEALLNIYRNYLLDEVNAAIREKELPSNINYYSKDVVKLGHFNEILGEKLMQQFTTKVLDSKAKKKMTADAFVNQAEVDIAITKYLKGLTKETLEGLIDLDILERVQVGVADNGKPTYQYTTNSISHELLNKVLGITDVEKMDEYDAEIIAAYLAINKQIGVVEQHKMFYGHPALYKDLAKRANGVNSTKDAIVDNPTVIKWMDERMKRFDGKVRSKDDIQTFNNVSFKDVTAVAKMYKDIAEGMYASLKNDLSKEEAEKNIGVKFDSKGKFKNFILDGKKFTGQIKAYVELNEADGQGWIMPDMFRDMMFLSSKFSKQQERQWAYEMAYEVVARNNKSKKDVGYRKATEEELSRSKEILKQGNPGVILQVLKPQYFGYAANNSMMQTVFLKHSVQPKFFRHVEGTQFEKMYLTAQKNQIDIIGFESGEKVGAIINSKGEFTSFYNDEGKINLQDDLSLIEGMSMQTLYTRYYGIQTEQSSLAKDKVVRGTQVTKLVMSNFRDENGYTSKKAESLIKNYNSTLEEMIALGKEELLDELGITKMADGSYFTTDIEKMIKLLRAEMDKRDLPDNLIDSININQNRNGLLYKFDTSANRDKIDNILSSIVDSRVISDKMHGKATVQVANTGYEFAGREMMYLNENGVYESATDKELTEDQEKSLVAASSDLKFYTTENGGISKMEVYLPWYFNGITPEELGLKLQNGVYLVGDKINKSLLEAVGFRIPTQGMNSIENMVIKGFLPTSAGDMIVVPSEIVGKSGSDFDIDKLQTYLPNYYILGKTINVINPSLSTEEITKIAKASYAESIKLSEQGNELINNLLADLGTDPEEEKYVSKFVKNYKKQILQDRFRTIMSDIISLPENFRQLITPNGAETLKSLAKEVNELKGVKDAESSKVKLSEFIPMSETRERYLTGKRMVGIAALQTTSHTMSQIAGIKLSGKYDAKMLYYLFENTKQREVVIRLDHNETDKGELYLYAKKGKDGRWISEMLSEGLTGFVDAAKDPFVFSLNLSMNTAGTWFYLTKLGVPTKDIAYLFNQPAIDGYFKLTAKNNTFAKQANGDKSNNMMLVYKAMDPYFQAAFGVDYYNVMSKNLDEISNTDGSQTRTLIALRSANKKLREELAGKIAKLKDKYSNVSGDVMKEAIKNLNTPGYKMTKEDAELQISLLTDYLEYNTQARQLSEFISAIGYDNSKTRTIVENAMQYYRWEKMLDGGFIANPENILNDTFIGEMKTQKDDMKNVFKDYFISLSDKAAPIFEPLFERISNRDVFASKDDQVNLINRYQNFVISYLIQNMPYMKDGKETVLNSEYKKLFLNSDSLAKQLKALKESNDPNISENLVVKELLPILAYDTTQVDSIKLIRNKMDTYKNNVLIESIENLNSYAQASGNVQLQNFLENLTMFSILQSGLQSNMMNYSKVLPAHMYNGFVNNILNVFTSSTYTVDPQLVWKQFHQNNWKNDDIVPTVKYIKGKADNLNGIIKLSTDFSDSQYDFVKRTTVRPDMVGKANAVKRKELISLGQGYKVFQTVLYMKVASNELETTYQAINKLGDGYKFTETYNVDTDSILPQNNIIGSMGIVSSYIPQREEAAVQPTPVLGGQKFAIKATPAQPSDIEANKAAIKRRREQDNNTPARQSVKYKLQNKIAGIDNPTLGNEISNLSEAIKIAGAKLSTPIKINDGEITRVVFDQEESVFRFTYKEKQFAAFYIANARGKVRWQITKLNDKTGTYQSVSSDELKNINEKYGSERNLLLSLGAENLVEDIENFEKVEYSTEDKSSPNGIIPLENTVSAEQIRLGKKYGVTYTLEDFLKEYDAELAALENKQPKEKQIELKGKIYNASEINAAMLEKLGYSPTDIGKILKQLC